MEHYETRLTLTEDGVSIHIRPEPPTLQGEYSARLSANGPLGTMPQLLNIELQEIPGTRIRTHSGWSQLQANLPKAADRNRLTRINDTGPIGGHLTIHERPEPTRPEETPPAPSTNAGSERRRQEQQLMEILDILANNKELTRRLKLILEASDPPPKRKTPTKRTIP